MKSRDQDQDYNRCRGRGKSKGQNRDQIRGQSKAKYVGQSISQNRSQSRGQVRPHIPETLIGCPMTENACQVVLLLVVQHHLSGATSPKFKMLNLIMALHHKKG